MSTKAEGRRENELKPAASLAAAVLAALVLAVDVTAGLHAAVAMLYVLVLILGAFGRGRRAVLGWAVTCALLALLAFGLTDARAPSAESVLRLAFALLGLGVTAALLVSRIRLREAFAALRESEDSLGHFADLVPQVIFRADTAGRLTYYNGRYTEVTGRSVKETLARQDWLEVFHPEDAPAFLRLIEESRVDGQARRIQLRVRQADGRYRWMLVDRHPVRAPGSGEVTGWIGSALDVDDDVRAREEVRRLNAALEEAVAELRQANAALRESEANLRSLADLVPTVVWRADVAGNVTYFNNRYEEVTGQSVEEAVRDQAWPAIFHPEDAANYMRLRAESRRQGTEWRVQCRVRQAGGGYRWMLIDQRPVRAPEDGALISWMGVALDVDAEIRAQQEVRRLNTALEGAVAELRQSNAALRESEANLRNFADLVPLVIWRADTTGRIVYFNNRYEEVTGRDAGEAIANQSWPAIFHPEDLEGYMRVREACQADGLQRRTRARIRQADGRYLWMMMDRRPIRSPETGEVMGWMGAALDVEAETRAQDEIRRLNNHLEQMVEERTADLARSEQRFRTLFQDINIAYAEQHVGTAKRMLDALRAEGVSDLRAYLGAHPDFLDRCLETIRVVDANDALLRLMGYGSREELLGRPLAQLLEHAHRIMTAQLEALFEERRHFTAFVTLIGRDGRRVPVAVGVNVPSDWTTSLSTHIDMTEQIRAHEMALAAQKQLARANQAATIGALSSSLAHELNQPILAMVVDAQTCKRWLALEPPAIDQLLRTTDRLSRNAERVSAIVRQTRDRMVKGRRSVVPVDLAALLQETQLLLEPDLQGRGTALRIACEPGLPAVLADRTELQQVFVNLILNAAEAMVAVPEAERAVAVTLRRAGAEEVEATVQDSGPGIPEADFPRLFEPFFTTKPGGVGLGLQICRATIEAFGGTLGAANRPEGGAVFRFALPAAPEAGAEDP